MKWEGQRRSDNVEDRRAGGGLPRLGGGRGIGLGTIVIALVAGWLFGINLLTLLGLLGGGDLAPPAAEAPATAPPPGDTQATFVATVLADTEDVWGALMRAGGAAYREPKLVLFRDATRSACGVGQAAMGPFYCPADEKVCIDLGFFDTLQRRSQGHVVPGSFTRGTSAQRQRWLQRGYASGSLDQCDTFAAATF